MMDALTRISTRLSSTSPAVTRGTPQSLPDGEAVSPNSAGGYVFGLDDVARLRRFLMLGVDGGTYYASAAELAASNAEVVLRMCSSSSSARKLVDVVVEISESGRAPRQNPGLFALAVCAGTADAEGRKYALSMLDRVARTGTSLFQFLEYVQQFRGWGRGLRRAVASWYEMRDAQSLAYQMVKYRGREGWTHRDALRLSHARSSAGIGLAVSGPGVLEAARADVRGRVALYDWACGREGGLDLPKLVRAHLSAMKASRTAEWVALVRDYGLSWEMLPDVALGSAEVWEAMLDADSVPLGALIRQLPRLTRLGVTRSRRDAIVNRLVDVRALRLARIHPMNVLVAQKTYASGGGSGRSTAVWTPDSWIVDALDACFYASFGAVEPSGKRTLLALDVSGSMGAQIAGMPLTAREASAAMALVTLATEGSGTDVVGFTAGAGRGRSWGSGWSTAITPLVISPRQRLDDVVRSVAGLPFGATDCALPMLWALEQRREYDTVVIFTDNETWAGDVHPFQALKAYRAKMGIAAKLVVVGMTSTGFSIADPSDAGMLDLVGFDSAAPGLISAFSRGF